MLDPAQNSSRPLISITPRKKSVRFNITSPSPRTFTQPETNPRQHPLNVSYTIPSTNVNIDHVTNQSHNPRLNNQVEYIPTTRRAGLQINGQKITPPPPPTAAPPQAYDELQQFMKIKAENLRKNMTQVATTFNHASAHLNRLKEDQQNVLKRPSRIPVSTRLRSPSPPVVIYKKPQHRSLDDLRWYCLARKFSILWQKRVFGGHLRRIKPLLQQRLLRKYFHQWKNSITNNPNDLIATEHYHRRLLKTSFHHWFNSLSQNQTALEFYHQTRIKNIWYTWRSQLQKRRLHQQQFQIANEQYHRRILSRVYQTWRMNTTERQKDLEKRVRAAYHYRIYLQRICFNALLTYTEYRRRKNLHKKRVQEYYQRRLIERIYSNWKEALARRISMQQNEQHLAQLQTRILTRWAFEQWKSHMTDLADEQHMMHLAEQYSDRRIMRSAFVILREYMMKRRMKQRLNWMAVQHRARTLERIYYGIWKNRLEHRENILMLEEFRKAESFYHMKITIRYWFCWRRYINDCRQENAQMNVAEKYHHSTLLRKYFYLLRDNVMDEQHEHVLEKRADDHYRLRYLRLYYIYWKTQRRTHEQYQMNWRIAIVHEETTKRQRMFNLWLERAHSRLIDNEQNIVAERHYIRTIIGRAWLSWRQLIDERHNEERAERIAVQFYYHTIERRVLNAWKLYIRHCQYMKGMYRQSEEFYLQHRGRSIFFNWLFKARDRRRLMVVVNERFNRIQRNTLRQCFRQWRDTIREEKDDRQLSQYALDHYYRVLKRKILLAWNNEMIQQISIENENEMKLNKYKEEKNLLSLQTIYYRWKNVTNERLRTRFLNQRAQRFYEHNLLKQIFFVWREQHQLDMRIKLLERQAIWFDRMRSISRVYLQWKQAWQSEQRLHQQKHRALLFWALELQKKCFVKWLIYVSERKRKKARYNEATHRRHDELLRNSLRQFLVYTDHTRQRRQALFIHQQVYLYHDRNALAAKYVSKWRAFVKQSLARKQHSQRLTTRNINITTIHNNPLDLVKFDNSPSKITNRPRPRKPAFLSESFSSTAVNKTPSQIPLINIRTSPASPPPPPPPPTIDHSIHSPFVSVKQPPIVRREPSPPLLLPPSAFQIDSNEIQMPLSSRPTTAKKTSIPHRPYSTQPSTTMMINKDNLLDVKQRLEIYLNNKAKLKRLRQQLANLSPSQIDPQLEQQCQQLSAFIASEKIHLTDVLQNL